MACKRDLAIENELSQIDSLCLVEPEKAIGLLDSIGLRIGHEDEHTLRCWQMLCIKAQDKANRPITADSVFDKINNVVKYFDNHGTVAERIEAYYYQGRVNHERHDGPRAVTAYLTAIDLSEKHGLPDVRVMTNATSQLAMVYRRQENPRASVEIARKGYKVAKRYGLLDPVFIMDVATGYRYLNMLDSVDYFFKQALDSIDTQGGDNAYAGCLSEMCAHYARVGDRDNADKCLERVNRIPEEYRDVNYYSSKATYFEVFGPADSALYYNLHELQDTTDLDKMHDAARGLVEICRAQGDYKHAYHYAQRYFELDDTLKAILRLEQTLAADKEYRYRRNLEEEANIYKHANKNKNLALIAVIILLVAVMTFSFYGLSTERRLRLKTELILQKEGELEGKNKELHQKDRLIDKMVQYTAANTITANSMDAIAFFRHAASSRTKVYDEQAWKNLLKEIEGQMPGFQQEIIKHWPDIDTEEIHIVCLLCIGIEKADIQYTIGQISRATIYRKVRKAEVLLKDIIVKKIS